MSVAIVDYGSGNLHSAAKAFERAAQEARAAAQAQIVVTRDPAVVAKADRVVLPGVGAFADCRRGLDAVDGMVAAIEEAVRRKGRPFFGICVGMQLLAERGREYEVTDGLGWIAGEVDRIAPRDASLKIPHMGWNTLNVVRPHPLLEGLPLGPDGRHAYFVHSYQLNPSSRADLVAEAEYGGPVTAVVGARQYCRHAIPSREEPAVRSCVDREFFEMDAVILFPAIDLKDGECVRLQHGDMARATVFNSDPAAQAQAFEQQGFEYLHVVDLDGAFAGKPMNAAAVERILAAVTMPVQLGGGIRDARRSRIGSARAWRGSSSARPRCATPRWCGGGARLSGPGRGRPRCPRRQGRGRGLGGDLRNCRARLAQRFEDAGVAAIIYTDIARDGMLKGLNIEATVALADASRFRSSPRAGCLDRRMSGALAPRATEARRRHRRPRALRRPARCRGGAGADRAARAA